MSTAFANLIYRYPIIMDAMASEVQRKGDSFMSKWAEIMTNMQPKTYFLRPDVAAQLGCAATGPRPTHCRTAAPPHRRPASACRPSVTQLPPGWHAWPPDSQTLPAPGLRRGAAASHRPPPPGARSFAILREVIEQKIIGKEDKYRMIAKA